jgi:hypothetical protein
MDFWTFFNDPIFSDGSIHSLLLILLNLTDEDTDKFLNEDNFKEGVENDGRKRFLLNELEKVKNHIRTNIAVKEPLRDDFGNFLSPMEIHRLVESYRLKINKLRLMINYELMLAHNTYLRSNIVYVAARGLWLDNSGKKFKKFSKNIGTIDTVYDKNGKIHESLKRESENEIIQMMWETYKMEHPESFSDSETG